MLTWTYHSRTNTKVTSTVSAGCDSWLCSNSEEGENLHFLCGCWNYKHFIIYRVLNTKQKTKKLCTPFRILLLTTLSHGNKSDDHWVLLLGCKSSAHLRKYSTVIMQTLFPVRGWSLGIHVSYNSTVTGRVAQLRWWGLESASHIGGRQWSVSWHAPLASFPDLPTVQFLIPANNTASDQKLDGGKTWKGG